MSSGYLSGDTIAAPATAAGGAVAIVRVSGPGAFAALARLSRAPETAAAEPRRLSRARFHDPDGLPLDDGLFVRFVGPESYTGEDVVELHLHGGAYAGARVLEALAAAGARPALPGEFSFRAVRNGKLSLPQAQAVADLIAASNEGALSLALEKLSGTQNRLLQAIATDLRRVAALSEAGIDFSDQDLDELALSRLRDALAPPVQALSRLHEGFARGTRLQEGVRVAFIGLPNAGKSSFFNALLGEERSLVSAIPGTTRDVVHERLTLRTASGSVTLRVEDTAGLRSSEDPVESLGIDRSRRAARDADAIVLLVDPLAPDSAVQSLWEDLGRPVEKTLGVLTKVDLARTAPPKLGVSRWIGTSAVTGEGISAAADALGEHCGRLSRRDPGECLLTRVDQARAVAAALEHLTRARSAEAHELVAADIRLALNSLGPLIGDTLPDDILGTIFSEFCIGK
jgi:tRNA modification GTPase